MSRLHLATALVSYALVAGCGGDSPELPDAAATCQATELDWGRSAELMLPSSDCLDCHRVGGAAASTPFTAAGSVFVGRDCPEGIEGALIHVEDSAGERIELTSNQVGNFYTALPLEAPLRVAVEIDGAVTEMIVDAPHGSCGSCHLRDSSLGFVTGDP